MRAHERIIFALDVPNELRAMELVRSLTGHVGAFKIGLELALGSGSSFIQQVTRDATVMLDLKLHDIPETVERAVLRAGNLGVKFCTLHSQQRETLRRAAKAAEKTGTQLLTVTVLTSMTSDDLYDMRLMHTDPERLARYRAQTAWEEGITGFVCSPKEVKRLREDLPDAVFVVPGIRPAGTATGDQKRVGTPAEAIRDGANYLVVGRPIRDAADPVAAADAIGDEMASCLEQPV